MKIDNDKILNVLVLNKIFSSNNYRRQLISTLKKKKEDKNEAKNKLEVKSGQVKNSKRNQRISFWEKHWA